MVLEYHLVERPKEPLGAVLFVTSSTLHWTSGFVLARGKVDAAQASGNVMETSYRTVVNNTVLISNW